MSETINKRLRGRLDPLFFQLRVSPPSAASPKTETSGVSTPLPLLHSIKRGQKGASFDISTWTIHLSFLTRKYSRKPGSPNCVPCSLSTCISLASDTARASIRPTHPKCGLKCWCAWAFSHVRKEKGGRKGGWTTLIERRVSTAHTPSITRATLPSIPPPGRHERKNLLPGGLRRTPASTHRAMFLGRRKQTRGKGDERWRETTGSH